MQQFSLVYNNLFVFLEPVHELRPTYDCGQLMQGSSTTVLLYRFIFRLTQEMCISRLRETAPASSLDHVIL